MGKIHILSFLFAALFTTASAQVPGRKIDTTALFGNVGYRVTCNNKSETENSVTISPKGFKSEAREVSFTMRGRLRKILVDDLNDDGFPDLLLCIYSGTNFETGNITGISSVANTSLVPAYFPDIYNDPKLRIGYKGHDEFSTVVGTLLRSFPIYKEGDTDTPTGGIRVIQYKIIPGENSRLTFKVLRTYEKPQ